MTDKTKKPKKNKTKKIPKKKKQKFDWKKHFCTVTPLSKYLALSIFTVLPFLGFMLGASMNTLFSDCATTATSTGTSTPQEEVVLTKEVHRLMYKDAARGFTFEYPLLWGAVQYESDPLVFTEDDYEAEVYEGIDLDTVQLGRWYIEFEERQCEQIGDCWIGVQVYDFDEEHPLKISCSEEGCSTLDLVEDRERVSTEFNNTINDLDWICEDGALEERSMLGISCRTYIGDSLVKVSTGYFVSNFTDALEACGGTLSNVSCMSDFVTDSDDYEHFIDGQMMLLNSISISVD